MLTFGEIELRLRYGVHGGTVKVEIIISVVILKVMSSRELLLDMFIDL